MFSECTLCTVNVLLPECKQVREAVSIPVVICDVAILYASLKNGAFLIMLSFTILEKPELIAIEIFLGIV